MGGSMLAITEEHHDLAAAAIGALTRADSRRAARITVDTGTTEHSTQMLRRAAELGWTGLAIPEAFGGSGFGLAELAIVLEAQGHEICPGPFLPTVAASTVIDRYASDSLRAQLLPGLVDGSTVGALGSFVEIASTTDGLISGTAPVVLGAPEAAELVLVCGDDVVVVDRRAPGVTVTALPALDATRTVGAVVVQGMVVDPERLLRGAARQARTVFRILSAAEAVGSAWACVEMAREYAKVREQFGRTIGTFQAVKHHAADMLIAAEQLTAATWDAARCKDLGGAWFSGAVAAANAISASILIAQKNIQLHGGIGYTWEHDAHLYLRRARMLTALLAADEHPLSDVVEAQRTGKVSGAAFVLPPEAESHRGAARDAAKTLQALPGDRRRDFLVDSGYLVPHWRKPWGLEAGAIEQLVIEEEFDGIELTTLGITGWVMLTISEAGSEQQCERWIEPALRGEANWCQLFSEPGAGSDAAAVRTAARRVDGGWQVSGQKIWTSLAQQCQWGLATVRTDSTAAKHAGVTMMAIDMSAPGVSVRPLRELTGDAMFNEVFFDDVFIPDADVIGEEGKGWAVARATLGNERVSIAGGEGIPGLSPAELVDLLDRAPVGTATSLMRRTGAVIAEAHSLRLLNLRRASRAMAGASAGPEASLAKLLTAEGAQRQTELGMELAGTAAVVGQSPEVTASYLYARSLTIAGGTSEIMRNNIAERLLGFPRDPLTK